MATYELTDSQAGWIAELLRMASDPDTGILDTTSGGGYRDPEQAARVYRLLGDTARSLDQQKDGGPAVLRELP